MRKQFLRVAIALVSFAGFGVAAKAQAVDQIVVNIPFEFVAAGKTLPAGTYRATRISEERWEGLFLTSSETGARVILHPIEVDSIKGDNVHASFERAGEEKFLSTIETGENVYTFAVSRADILQASARPHSGTATGNASGAN
jgi:hypothetical protein